MKDKKFLVPLCIAAIVIAVGFIIWKGYGLASGTAEQAPGNVGGQTPAPRANSPDFGPLPDENVIGKNPRFATPKKGG